MGHRIVSTFPLQSFQIPVLKTRNKEAKPNLIVERRLSLKQFC